MKTIKMLHLYYDLLNLYGENGNVRYLIKQLNNQGIEVELEKLSLNDPIHFKDYDIVYVGSGTEDALENARKNISAYRQDIYESMKTSFYIITGNALTLFGNDITYLNGSTEQGMRLLDFSTIEVSERIVGAERYKTDLIPNSIIGFHNRSFNINNIKETPLFKLINEEGIGAGPEITTEGIYRKNIFATFLIGPLLVRNPYLTNFIVKQICSYANTEYKEPNTNEPAYLAYNEYLKNFYS